jgi:DNA polymerase-1
MNMGILTGMQPKTFAMHMGWSLEKATVMHRQWFQGFPGIANFQNSAKRVLAHRGYVRTILGRRGRLDHPRYAYKAVSKIIQGSNADIMKAKILLCDEYLESTGDTGWLLLSIYDSLEWESPQGPEGEAQAAELIRICKDVQGPPFNLRVPLGMDVDHGPDWATATYGAELVRGKLSS